MKPDDTPGPSEPGFHPADDAEALIEELQQQAAQLEEQASELEALNEALSASEARMRGIVNSALDAVIATDSNSVILEWSRNAETMFGWTAEEAVGRTLSETIIPPQHRQAHQRGVERYLATGEGPILNQRIEITALRRGGEEFPVELTVAPVRWGAHLVFTSFVRDLSIQKRQERLQEAQQAVTRVLAGAPALPDAIPLLLQAICEAVAWHLAGFWTLDAGADRLRFAGVWSSPSLDRGEFEAASGGVAFAPGEGLPGRVWASGEPVWVPDVTLDANFARLASAAALGLKAAFAFPILVGDEFLGVMEFFQRAAAEPDPQLLAAMREISSDLGQFLKRRHTEARLQKREEILAFVARVSETLATSTPDYEETLKGLADLAVPVLCDWCTVYVSSETGRVVRLQMAYADPSKEPIARALDAYPISAGGEHPAVHVIRTGDPMLLPEVPADLIDGVAQDEEHARLLRSLGLESAMVVPLRARGRTLGSIVLVATGSGRRFGEEDLEVAMEFAHRAALAVDNARLFNQAQQANRAKTEFIATMSHELRTPLNAIIGYTELLEQGIPVEVPEAALGFLGRVGLSARYLLQLIEEILAYSRLEAGRETVVWEDVDLATVLREVCAILEPLSNEKGLGFVVRQPPQPIEMRSDQRKLRQILLNLLGNAIKFTDRGSIELIVRSGADDVLFEIRDSGIGIEPADLADIFEPFWQVHQGTTRTAPGTGLGLSVSRRFASLLGGSISVQSTPGVGSVFTLTLPRHPVETTSSK